MLRHLISTAPFLLLLLCNESCKTSSKAIATNNNDTIPTGVLAFLTTRDGNFEIYTMTADGNNITNLTNNKSLDFWSLWSPDGKWIAYTSGSSKQYDVWVINLETKNKLCLTRDSKRNETPVWRPE